MTRKPLNPKGELVVSREDLALRPHQTIRGFGVRAPSYERHKGPTDQDDPLSFRATVRRCTYRMKNRFPRIRFVALRTASAAPRAESASARKQPTSRCPFPSSV